MRPAAVARWVRENGDLARAAMVGIACLVVLNIADVATTRLALQLAAHHGKLAVEGNPLARALLPAGRVEVAKVVIIVLLGINTIRRRPTLRIVCAVWVAVGVYFMTILNNLFAIAAMK